VVLGIFGAEGCALFVFVYFLVDNFADDNFGFDRKLAINRKKIELCIPLGSKYVGSHGIIDLCTAQLRHS
jgi:hypothetical protein